MENRMKRLFAVLIFFLFLPISFAAASRPDYAKYYTFSDNFEVSFRELSKDEVKKLGKEEEKLYKNLVKNENYIKKGKYEKAEKLNPDLIPNLSRLSNAYIVKKDYPKALDYAKQVEAKDKTNLFTKAAKDYKLGVLYSLNGDYFTSNKYLMPYLNKNPDAVFQIAQNYYYMQDFKTAALYAERITPQSIMYQPAQELLYKVYNLTKNSPKAYKAAVNLIRLTPDNPENYVNLARVTSNNAEKLKNYNIAKQLYYAQKSDLGVIGIINNYIAPLEQAKIDSAYKKISVYCKKPDWKKIREKNKNLLPNDMDYWDRRQNEFFEFANDCISRYSGNNLAACFSDLNTTQEKLDKELLAEHSRREEEAQREAQIQLLLQQNALIQEQNNLQRMRYYNYYYPRYRWWWY